MELTVAGMVWLAVAAWLLARLRTNRNYPQMKDAELIRLLDVQKRRLAAAGTVGCAEHDAALRRLGRLMDEVKRRGLVAADAFVHDPFTLQSLEHEAQDRFSRSVGEVQASAEQGDAAALYQLGVLFRLAWENQVALSFIAKAAEAGDAQAQFAWALALLGTEDEAGSERQQDALTWLRLAAAQGHAQAELAVAGLVKSLPATIVWPALRQARRRMKRGGPVPVHSTSRLADAASASCGLLDADARQSSFG
jgi:hypothetical protein